MLTGHSLSAGREFSEPLPPLYQAAQLEGISLLSLAAFPRPFLPVAAPCVGGGLMPNWSFNYMRGMRVVKVTYWGLMFFCICLILCGVSRSLGYQPPGGVCCLRRYEGRRSCLRVLSFCVPSTRCPIRLEALCRSLSCPSWTRTGVVLTKCAPSLEGIHRTIGRLPSSVPHPIKRANAGLVLVLPPVAERNCL